jgi:hypothetical protein
VEENGGCCVAVVDVIVIVLFLTWKDAFKLFVTMGTSRAVDALVIVVEKEATAGRLVTVVDACDTRSLT